MNKRIKKLWVDALRSGKYTQSKHALRTVSGYCCLGVLCDLATEESDIAEWVQTSIGWQFVPKDRQYSPMSDALPVPIQEWAELDGRNPQVSQSSLAYLNDVGRYVDGGVLQEMDFNMIADIIEREL